MDRDFLIDLFADFGLVTIRRMFSGFGISADGINFALALRGGVYLRADEASIPRFEAEGAKPFQYQQSTTAKTITVNSYWQLPARLFDDSEELASWARAALAAAQRAALRKPPKARKGAARKAAKKAKAMTPVVKKSAVRKKWSARKKARRKRPSS
jgi:DNA transformation protein and related proteins